MRVTTSKSKNSESFYITKSYTNTQGKSTSTTIKKLGTLAELSERLGTDRDGVMAWAKEQARNRNGLALIVMVSWHGQKNRQESKRKNIKKKRKMP